MGLFNWGKNKISSRKEKIVEGTKRVTNYREIEENRETMAELFRHTLNPYAKKRKAKSETFENAYQRLNLNEETLSKVYRNYVLRFYICLGFSVLGIIMLVNAILSKNIWGIGPCIGVMFVTLSQMCNFSLRACQINKRELISFSEWYSSSDNWFPPNEMQELKQEKRIKRKRKTERKDSPLLEEKNEEE